MANQDDERVKKVLDKAEDLVGQLDATVGELIALLRGYREHQEEE